MNKFIYQIVPHTYPRKQNGRMITKPSKNWKCGLCHKPNRQKAYEVHKNNMWCLWVCSPICADMYILQSI